MNNPWKIVFIFLFFFFFYVKAQPNPPDSSDNNIAVSFRPSIAVVIGVLSIMFSLTFLLLMYAKFCQNNTDAFNRDDQQQILPHQRARFSGIDKTVIESLPFFRFSSLKGSREGLECAVCISKFEETEILRLLPKCKHAFHIDCIDRWLESHSSCPICRKKIELEDLTVLTYSNSLRFGRNPSELNDDTNVELFVQRESENEGSSSRFSIGNSFRMIEKKKKDPLIAAKSENQQFHHKFKHRIIVSDVVQRQRWSDVNSSDLMFLNSEMLNIASSKRFSAVDSNSERFAQVSSATEIAASSSNSNENILKIKEEMERKRLLESMASKINRSKSVPAVAHPSTIPISDATSTNTSRFLIPSGKRSMSEITNFARFPDFGWKTRTTTATATATATTEAGRKEEKRRKLWLPIARRTVQWFAGRERRSQSQSQYTRQLSSAV